VLRRALPLLLLVASLSACARDKGSAPPAAPPPTAAAPVTPSAPAAPGNTVVGDLVAAAATQQEGRDPGTSTDSGETQLERIAALPSEGQLPAVKWVAGTQYKVVSPAQPTNVAPGKVEVIEFFWYACPHCYAIDPAIETWRKNKAAYIQFVRVPVTWDEPHRAHARLFYTLQVLGKEEALHTKVFDAVQQDHEPLYSPGDPMATQRAQLQFAKDNGISEADFTKAYSSFAVQTAMQEADDLERRLRIEAVPTFAVAGKYLTDMAQAGGERNLFDMINDLAASEKHH
jgi:protein dithiol oxidoreductase (disulfide-forming)